MYECGLSLNVSYLTTLSPAFLDDVKWQDACVIWWGEAGDTALGDYWPSDNMSEGESSELDCRWSQVTETVKNEPMDGVGGTVQSFADVIISTHVFWWNYSEPTQNDKT